MQPSLPNFVILWAVFPITHSYLYAKLLLFTLNTKAMKNLSFLYQEDYSFSLVVEK